MQPVERCVDGRGFAWTTELAFRLPDNNDPKRMGTVIIRGGREIAVPEELDANWPNVAACAPRFADEFLEGTFNGLGEDAGSMSSVPKGDHQRRPSSKCSADGHAELPRLARTRKGSRYLRRTYQLLA